MQRKSYGSGPDYGDIIYFLPTIQHLGGGDLYAMKALIPKMPALQDLIESQPYIESFKAHKGERLNYNVPDFRKGGIPYGMLLAENQARWLGVHPDFSKPWLFVEPDPEMAGRIVVNRTQRYQNHFFPWRELVEQFGRDMVFVGTSAEHKQFCMEFGEVFYLPTKTLLEVAQAIAGAELFIGNQSSPNAICDGLKAPLVQETCLFVPDCIFPRKAAIHCCDGALDFEALGKRFQSEPKYPKRKADTSVTPPGGWRVTYEGITVRCYAFDSVLAQLKIQLQTKGRPVPKDLKEQVIEQVSLGLPVCDDIRPVIMCRELIQQKYSAVA